MYSKIDNAIETCLDHIEILNREGIVSKEIEYHLTCSLILLIVSEYEEYIENFFVKRVEKDCNDTYSFNYFKDSFYRKLKNPKIDKISTFLKKFDKSYNDSFREKVNDNEYSLAWDSLINARHIIAHGDTNQARDITLTLQEVINDNISSDKRGN